MDSTSRANWKTRVVRGGFPDRRFDIEFWQRQGDEAIFRTAWEMIAMAEEFKHDGEPRLKELLRAFNAEESEYLIVGGYAVMKYTEPRFTKYLDLWVRNSPNNAEKVYRALTRFGAPLENDGLRPSDFAGDDMTYQIGIEPIRIDVLTRISGVRFFDAWKNRLASTFLGIPVHFISLDDLIVNKRAAGRSSDLEQLEHLLTEIPRKKSGSS